MRGDLIESYKLPTGQGGGRITVCPAESQNSGVRVSESGTGHLQLRQTEFSIPEGCSDSVIE